MVDTDTHSGKVASGAALAAVLVGVLVLVGWSFHLDILKSVLNGTVTMNPVTALNMVLAGTSLWLSLRA